MAYIDNGDGIGVRTTWGVISPTKGGLLFVIRFFYLGVAGTSRNTEDNIIVITISIGPFHLDLTKTNAHVKKGQALICVRRRGSNLCPPVVGAAVAHSTIDQLPGDKHHELRRDGYKTHGQGQESRWSKKMLYPEHNLR